MPQNAETGQQGYRNGYNYADEIGVMLKATRKNKTSNEFTRQDGKSLLIKTGSPAVVATRATLGRIDFIIYGDRSDGSWVLYEICPKKFEDLSGQSRSRNHNENYRSVSRTLIREHGRLLFRAP